MIFRSNSFLVHVPQNEDGKKMLDQVVFFQKSLNMRAFLMDILGWSSILFINPGKRKNQVRHRRELNAFTDFISSAIGVSIPVNLIPRIGWGKVVNTLIKESERGGYEFVMIDKSARKNAEGLGKSKIDKFVSRSFCPVLLVDKDRKLTSIKKIVIPIDICQHTQKRLYWATFFARKFNAGVQIVSALNINIKETKSLAYKNAESIKKMLEARKVDCEIKILKTLNRPVLEAVLEHIEQEQPDLVIIRTHQKTHFSGKRIGKFVSGIIHSCAIPVFTVGGITNDYDVDSI